MESLLYILLHTASDDESSAAINSGEATVAQYCKQGMLSLTIDIILATQL